MANSSTLNRTGTLSLQFVYAVAFFYSIFSITHAPFAEGMGINLLGTTLPYGLHLLVPALMSTAILLLLSSLKKPKAVDDEKRTETAKPAERKRRHAFEDSNLLLKNIFLSTLIFVSVDFIGEYAFSAMQWAQYISLGAMALTLMHQAFFAAIEWSWEKDKKKKEPTATLNSHNDPDSPLHPGAWKKNLLENGLQKTLYEKLLFETNVKFLSICLASSCSFAMFYMMTYSLQGNATLASLSGFALYGAVGCILLGIACNVLSRRILMLMQYAMNRMDTEKASNIGRQLLRYKETVKHNNTGKAESLNTDELAKAMILKAFAPDDSSSIFQSAAASEEATADDVGAAEAADPEKIKLQGAIHHMGRILYKTLDAAEKYSKNINKREKKPLFFDTERERFIASMRRALLILHALDALRDNDKELVKTQLIQIYEHRIRIDQEIKALQETADSSATGQEENAPIPAAALTVPTKPTSCPKSCKTIQAADEFKQQMNKAYETLGLQHSLALSSCSEAQEGLPSSGESFSWLDDKMREDVSSGKDRHPSSGVVGLALTSMLIGMSSEFSKIWLLVADNTLPDMFFHSQHIWLIIIAGYLLVDQVAYMLWMVNVPNPEIAHTLNKAGPTQPGKQKSIRAILQDNLLSFVESVGSIAWVGLLGGGLYAAGLVSAGCQITLLALICGTLFFKKAKDFLETIAKIPELKEKAAIQIQTRFKAYLAKKNSKIPSTPQPNKPEPSFVNQLIKRFHKIKESTTKGDPILLNTAWNCIKKVLEFFVLFYISGGGALGLVVALIPAIVNSLRALYTSNTMAKPPETAPDPLFGKTISESQSWLKAAAALIVLITSTCLLSNWFEAIGYIKHFANTVSIPLQYQGFFATFWASLGACTFIAVVGGYLFNSLKYAFKEKTLAEFYHDVFGTINTSDAVPDAGHAAAPQKVSAAVAPLELNQLENDLKGAQRPSQEELKLADEKKGYASA